MAYCDDCGLTSCYERGGTCPRKPPRAPVPRINRFVDNTCTYAWTGGSWPGLDTDWIEYVPEPPGCPGCGNNPMTSCWICR